MKLEIITHCYCPPGQDHYAKCLDWQWRSLCIHDFGKFTSVKLTVCASSQDEATYKQLAYMLDHPGTVDVELELMPYAKLFRRAIGRNMIARRTKADLVWFADADYFVGKEFYPSLCEVKIPYLWLEWPETYWINSSHEVGDSMVNEEPFSSREWSSGFKLRKQRKPIGGLFFVSGETARNGYLDGTRHQKEVDPEKGFRQCRCDVPYRKGMMACKPNSIEGIYRLRHTVNGRDYYLDGTKGEGKAAWR